MRFVELIHLRSAASSPLEPRRVDEAGGELKLGQDTERGLSPCPPVPSAFSLVLGCRTPSGASGLAGKGNARVRAGLWGCAGPGLCPQVFGRGSGSAAGCHGWDSTAEHLGTVFGSFRGCPVPQPRSRGKGCCACWHSRKVFRGEIVQGQPGCGCLRPPELFSRTGGCPCKGEAREGESRRKRPAESGGFRVSFAVFVNCWI